MPYVKKTDCLNVARQLWSSTGVVEDEAKLILAELLINEIWQGNKAGIPLNQTGQTLKEALRDRWLSSHERSAAGKQPFGQVLSADPYFHLKDVGGTHPNVQLRISLLAQLIANPDLVSEYRRPASSAGAGSSSGAGSSRSAAGVQLTDDGLPIRPGEPVCQHYAKHGWCLFKQDCWYSHPAEKAGKRGTKSNSLVESHLEPGIMLRNGVNPIRPGAKVCAFYVKNGWCAHKAACRNDHPDLREYSLWGAADPAKRISPTPDQQDIILVRHPPMQLLLGVLIDAVYPPSASKETFVKGTIARHILETMLKPEDIHNEHKVLEMGGAAVGNFLTKWWHSQHKYDPSYKPYKSLAELLRGDPYFKTGTTPNGVPQVYFQFGHLINTAGPDAADYLCRVADTVWPPSSGKDIWLRGQLAKWMMTAAYVSGGAQTLRAILAVGSDSPTAFRIDMAIAGEYLRRVWDNEAHPYDKSAQPWEQLKPLIAGDRFLYIEACPGKVNAQHVTIDVQDMLQSYPALARKRQEVQIRSGSTSGASSTIGGAGSSRAAAGSTSGTVGSADDIILAPDDEDSTDDSAFAAPSSSSNATPVSIPAAGASSSSGRPVLSPAAGASSRSGSQGQQQLRQQRVRPDSRSDPASLEEAEADLAALQELTYEPPENMQWWWPEHKSENPNYSWTEVAIRLLDPAMEEFELQMTEMVQHLEISALLGVACATYKSHPHLLQFFAPHAAVAGLEIPSAVYLVDVMQSGPHLSNLLETVAEILASRHSTKVCHGSKLWSGQLEKAYNIKIVNYLDTQQANFVEKCLRFEAGKDPHMTPAMLKSTTEVSLAALLRSHDFYHPVRHREDRTKDGMPLAWQGRPLTDELITCAAADVVYLLPLLEKQLRSMRVLATEVRQHHQHQRPGSRAATLMNSLPPELADTSVLSAVAAGAEQRGGGLNYERVRQLGSLAAFHQQPLHDVNLSLLNRTRAR